MVPNPTSRGLAQRIRRLVVAAAVLGTATMLAAQTRASLEPGPDGEFVFTRIRYGGGLNGSGFRGGGNSWNHDYPQADRHISTILRELTTLAVGRGDTNVFRLDEQELFRHPIAYLSEPGFWTMNDAEAIALREYLLKGGFLIFDDFEGDQLDNLVRQLRRVLPEYHPVRIDISHPIFRSHFTLRKIDSPHPLVAVIPEYYALFEDNDPRKRMLAIINHNNDLAEYWEWSESDAFAVDPTNEAYRLGVNYIIYGMTH